MYAVEEHWWLKSLIGLWTFCSGIENILKMLIYVNTNNYFIIMTLFNNCSIQDRKVLSLCSISPIMHTDTVNKINVNQKQ